MVTRLSTNLARPFSRFGTGFKKVPVLLRDPGKRWRILLPGLALFVLVGGLLYYYEAV